MVAANFIYKITSFRLESPRPPLNPLASFSHIKLDVPPFAGDLKTTAMPEGATGARFLPGSTILRHFRCGILEPMSAWSLDDVSPCMMSKDHSSLGQNEAGCESLF